MNDNGKQTTVSVEERIAAGKALRDGTPLDSHGEWKPSKRRLDSIKSVFIGIVNVTPPMFVGLFSRI